MTLEIKIMIAAGGVAVFCLLVTLVCLVRLRKTRRQVAEDAERIDELENTLKRTREVIETNSQHSAELSRRIVWVETRIRQPKLTSEEVIDDSGEPPKLNITERRHRVVTLAARGQSPEAIATTIGMLPGEVELILNLDKASRSLR